MALVVEDGTGKPDSEAYSDATTFQQYCGARNMALVGYVTADFEAALRKAATYIEGTYRFRGTKATAAQAMSFPRAAGTTDYDNLAVAPVPRRVLQANCELAFIALSAELLPASERGGKIKSESTGPVSVAYEEGAPVGPAYLLVDNMLRPYLRLDSLPPNAIMQQPSTDAWMGNTLHDASTGPIPGATPEDAPTT